MPENLGLEVATPWGATFFHGGNDVRHPYFNNTVNNFFLGGGACGPCLIVMPLPFLD